jgi:1-acyl-sn-glycerol-3-phosphate acyltransferase
MKWPKLAKDTAFNILWIIGNSIKWLFFKVKLEGQENVPEEGAYLLVSNHQSYLDPVAVHVVSRRRLNFLMASEYYHDRRFRWFYDLFNCIPIDRSRANPKPMGKAIKMLLDGHEPLSVFPEGGIPDDDKLAVFQPGIGWLALRTQLPILPVLIKGTRDVLPFGKYFPRLKPVEIYIGKPFVLKPEGESLSRKEINQATQKIRDGFLNLAREKGLYEYFAGTHEEKGPEL